MIKIQRPTVNDVKDIQEVFYKAWLATYPNKEAGITVEDIEERFKDRLSEQTLKKRIEDISDASENKLFLVAKEDGVVAGVCKVKKEDVYNELDAIYVSPDQQRKGIGKMLWDKAREFLGEEKDIIVHVASYNEKAINFYKKMGFADTGKRFVNEKFKMPISGACIPEIEMIIKSKAKD
jgi:ribosomal protein S18 acetylase RimI-like enzyme